LKFTDEQKKRDLKGSNANFSKSETHEITSAVFLIND